MQERLAEQRKAARPPVFVTKNDPLIQWQMDQLGYQAITSNILPKNTVITCPDTFPVSVPPSPHIGSDSYALYHVDRHFNTLPSGNVVLVFVSELHPNEHTSKHTHPGAEPNAEVLVYEHYYPLYGTVRINGEILPQEGITITPGQEHQVTTKENEQGIILISMEGAERLPYDRLHITKTSPTNETTIYAAA